MKKLLSISLLICLIAPVGGTYLWLQYQKKMVKKSVKWKMIDGIDKSELVYFKFSKADSANVLNWKHSREFEYNGQMYDIVERENRGDSLFYWCWWDHEETKLNKALTQLIQKEYDDNPQRNEKRERLMDIYKQFRVNSFEFAFNNLFSEILSSEGIYSFSIKTFYSQPISPPPQ
ncbi:MAG: hypothetical protein WD048_17015 [Chitinophagales bacterium]